jgi:Fe-Mn family superoxide dismutase
VPAYSLPELPYDVAALEPHYPAEILALHHDKHHAAYVTGLNNTLDQLAEVRATGDYGSLVGLEKTMAFNLSGHILHSLFWQNLSPDGGDKPQGELAAAIDDGFGSFDAFRDQLTQATVLVQGSGWGALSWEPLGRRLIIEQIYDHQGSVGIGSTPLLVIDAWEHAYYLKWRNVRADYVKSMWNIVNWGDVAARFAGRRSG